VYLRALLSGIIRDAFQILSKKNRPKKKKTKIGKSMEIAQNSACINFNSFLSFVFFYEINFYFSAKSTLIFAKSLTGANVKRFRILAQTCHAGCRRVYQYPADILRAPTNCNIKPPAEFEFL